jgi:hypothetical protein
MALTRLGRTHESRGLSADLKRGLLRLQSKRKGTLPSSKPNCFGTIERSGASVGWRVSMISRSNCAILAMTLKTRRPAGVLVSMAGSMICRLAPLAFQPFLDLHHVGHAAGQAIKLRAREHITLPAVVYGRLESGQARLRYT